MENKLLDELTLMERELDGFSISRVFRSIGHNIFIDFGPTEDSKDQLESNKRCLWIGNAAWRLMRGDCFIVGSGNHIEDIDTDILQLLGANLLSIEFLNEFADIKIAFDNGMYLITFFSWAEENQWVMFSPNHDFGIDLLTEESRQVVTGHLKRMVFTADASRWRNHSEFVNRHIRKITYLDSGGLEILFEQGKKLLLDMSCWRLERKGLYLAGTAPENIMDAKNELKGLFERKITSSMISEDEFDLKLNIEGGYILKTFECC
ncbi:MAG: hypothetical protein P0S95_07625 [Rhabdochlamydiaceae bacterium]|nr:hypothetical protein [Candidatus Amphrikana amoebophyrae]